MDSLVICLQSPKRGIYRRSMNRICKIRMIRANIFVDPYAPVIREFKPNHGNCRYSALKFWRKRLGFFYQSVFARVVSQVTAAIAAIDWCRGVPCSPILIAATNSWQNVEKVYASLRAMEADEDQFPERLNLVLPLPYRILVIFLLGIWGFGVNVHVSSLCGIDIASLLHYKPRSSTTSGLHVSIYEVGSLLSAIVTTSLLIFWVLCGADPSNVYQWQVLPLLTAFATFLIMINPLDLFHKYGRFQFWRYFQRVSIGGIHLESRFADILLSDAITSYAKVMGDCWILSCMFLSRLPTTAKPNRACGGTSIVPLIMCLPSLARLRQCLTEYFASGRQNSFHAWNALKYASVFPVILISSVQTSVDENTSPEERNRQITLSRIWLLCAFINSIFSFYWDVANDWDLKFFHPAEKANTYRRLRSPLFFPPFLYYCAIVLDLILRMTWSLKLSPHLIEVYEYEGGIFILEILEVFRRWMWVFFRVEAEQIRRIKNHGVAASNGIELLSNINEEYLD